MADTKKLSAHEVVKKIIGEIQPIGESTTDAVRFENLDNMIELALNLIEDIAEVHDRNSLSKEFSVKKASDNAYKFLVIVANR